MHVIAIAAHEKDDVMDWVIGNWKLVIGCTYVLLFLE